MVKVSFIKEGEETRVVEVDYATRLIDVCKENDLPVIFGCGGDGRCGSCIVKIVEGSENLSDPRPRERNKLRDVGRSHLTHRYACMCRVKGDVSFSSTSA